MGVELRCELTCERCSTRDIWCACGLEQSGNASGTHVAPGAFCSSAMVWRHRRKKTHCEAPRDSRMPEGMRLAFVAIAAALALGACVSGPEPEPKPPCDRLRDHMVDVHLADASMVNKEAHRNVLQRALGDDFVARCEAQLSLRQVECALKATSSSALAACEGNSSRR